MTDTTFQQRLIRIEQARQIRDGLCPEPAPLAAPTEADATDVPSATAPVAAPASTGPGAARFSVGFLWIFATIRLAADMTWLQGVVGRVPTLAPFEDEVMLGVVILIAFSMTGFAWVLKRATFGRKGRALALGAVAGFAAGAAGQALFSTLLDFGG